MDMKSSLVIAGGIVLGFLILGMCQRFEVAVASGQIIRLDKATGKIWWKYVQPPLSGTTSWVRLDPKEEDARQ